MGCKNVNRFSFALGRTSTVEVGCQSHPSYLYRFSDRANLLHLINLGFDKVFEKRNWPGNRFCIFKKNIVK